MSRTELQDFLCTLLGSENVYFQPPASLRMSYPCIVYKLDSIEKNYADGTVYSQRRAYQVTLVDKNPDNITVGKLSELTECRFIRHYTADNLNHYVFVLYY